MFITMRHRKYLVPGDVVTFTEFSHESQWDAGATKEHTGTYVGLKRVLGRSGGDLLHFIVNGEEKLIHSAFCVTPESWNNTTSDNFVHYSDGGYHQMMAAIKTFHERTGLLCLLPINL